MRSVLRVDLQFAGGEPRTCVWPGEGVQIMRVRLEPGEALPPHQAGANVVLVPLQGQVRFVNDDTDETVGVGAALAVNCGTPMAISNADAGETIFIVVKTEPKA